MATNRTPRTAHRADPPAQALPASKARVAPAPKADVKAPAAAAPAAKPAKPAKAAKPERKGERPRPTLVRDGFTMPEGDFALIALLKARALKAQRTAKKSELLRAGLHALAALDAKTLVAALGKLEPVQTGRPKKGR